MVFQHYFFKKFLWMLAMFFSIGCTILSGVCGVMYFINGEAFYNIICILTAIIALIGYGFTAYLGYKMKKYIAENFILRDERNTPR